MQLIDRIKNCAKCKERREKLRRAINSVGFIPFKHKAKK